MGAPEKADPCMPSQAQSRIGAFGGWARAVGSSGTLWLRPCGQAEAKLKDEEKRMARRLESQVAVQRAIDARSAADDVHRATTMHRATSMQFAHTATDGIQHARCNMQCAGCNAQHTCCNMQRARCNIQRTRTSASLQIAQIEAKKDEEAALGTQQHTPHQMWAKSRVDVGWALRPPIGALMCASVSAGCRRRSHPPELPAL
jgi:hypothetical protein